MSDLISRSKVIAVLEQLEEHSLSGKMDISNAIYLLNNQPTAYDIDKVVEELRRMSGNGYRDVDGDYVPPMIETKNAIEIVKHCGVSDDVCEWRMTDTKKLMPYKTSCGNEDLYDNSYKYCPYCGKKILCKE